MQFQEPPGLQAEEISSSSPPEEPLVAVFADEFPQEVMGFGDWDVDRDVNLSQSQVGSVEEQHA